MSSASGEAIHRGIGTSLAVPGFEVAAAGKDADAIAGAAETDMIEILLRNLGVLDLGPRKAKENPSGHVDWQYWPKAKAETPQSSHAPAPSGRMDRQHWHEPKAEILQSSQAPAPSGPINTQRWQEAKAETLQSLHVPAPSGRIDRQRWNEPTTESLQCLQASAQSGPINTHRGAEVNTETPQSLRAAPAPTGDWFVERMAQARNPAPSNSLSGVTGAEQARRAQRAQRAAQMGWDLGRRSEFPNAKMAAVHQESCALDMSAFSQRAIELEILRRQSNVPTIGTVIGMNGGFGKADPRHARAEQRSVGSRHMRPDQSGEHTFEVPQNVPREAVRCDAGSEQESIRCSPAPQRGISLEAAAQRAQLTNAEVCRARDSPSSLEACAQVNAIARSVERRMPLQSVAHSVSEKKSRKINMAGNNRVNVRKVSEVEIQPGAFEQSAIQILESLDAQGVVAFSKPQSAIAATSLVWEIRESSKPQSAIMTTSPVLQNGDAVDDSFQASLQASCKHKKRMCALNRKSNRLSKNATLGSDKPNLEDAQGKADGKSRPQREEWQLGDQEPSPEICCREASPEREEPSPATAVKSGETSAPSIEGCDQGTTEVASSQPSAERKKEMPKSPNMPVCKLEKNSRTARQALRNWGQQPPVEMSRAQRILEKPSSGCEVVSRPPSTITAKPPPVTKPGEQTWQAIPHTCDQHPRPDKAEHGGSDKSLKHPGEEIGEGEVLLGNPEREVNAVQRCDNASPLSGNGQRPGDRHPPSPPSDVSVPAAVLDDMGMLVPETAPDAASHSALALARQGGHCSAPDSAADQPAPDIVCVARVAVSENMRGAESTESPEQDRSAQSARAAISMSQRAVCAFRHLCSRRDSTHVWPTVPTSLASPESARLQRPVIRKASADRRPGTFESGNLPARQWPQPREQRPL